MRTTEEVLQEANRNFLNKLANLKREVDFALDAIWTVKNTLEDMIREIKREGEKYEDYRGYTFNFTKHN